MLKITPNILTISRIILAPIYFILFINHFYMYAFLCFFIASVTDFLDGYIARKFGHVSTFGTIYDPFADKILFFFGIIALLFSPLLKEKGFIENWMIFSIIFRDIIITLLRFRLKNKGIIMKADFLGKIKTVFQMLAIYSSILFLILDEKINNEILVTVYPSSINLSDFIPLFPLLAYVYIEIYFLNYIFIFLVVLTLLSGINYFHKYRQNLF